METATDPRTRAERFLADEPVVWLSSVRPDGRPHLVPIWFRRDGRALIVLSRPHAQKVRNIRLTPTVMLALGDAEEGFGVGLIEASAEALDEPATELPRGHRRKYADRMAALGLSVDEFLSTCFAPLSPIVVLLRCFGAGSTGCHTAAGSAVSGVAYSNLRGSRALHSGPADP